MQDPGAPPRLGRALAAAGAMWGVDRSGLPDLDDVGARTSLTTSGAPYEVEVAVTAGRPPSTRATFDLPSGAAEAGLGWQLGRRALGVWHSPADLAEFLDVAVPDPAELRPAGGHLTWLGVIGAPGRPAEVAAHRASVGTGAASGVTGRLVDRWPVTADLLDLIPQAAAPTRSISIQAGPGRPASVAVHRSVLPGEEHLAVDAMLDGAGGRAFVRSVAGDLQRLGLDQLLGVTPALLSTSADAVGSGVRRVAIDLTLHNEPSAAHAVVHRAATSFPGGAPVAGLLDALAGTGDAWQPTRISVEASTRWGVDRLLLAAAPSR